MQVVQDAPMLALADAVILSSGWKRRLIAFVGGAFGALALAPLDIGPALIVPMCVAVWLLDGAHVGARGAAPIWPGVACLRLAFGAGWWLGFGYFIAGFWWLSAAFLIDPEFTWALPLGVIGLPAILALFPAFGFALARLLWTPGCVRVLALAVGLGASEWARGHLFSGFPWNPLGMGLGDNLVTAQAASLFGLDGLNLATVALFAAPATLADGVDGRLSWRPTLVALAVFGVFIAHGALRLARPAPGNVPHVVVRIVQPGLRPDANFSPENKDAIVNHYVDLSKRDDIAKGIKLDSVTMLVWPESAFPFILTRDPDMLARIGAALPPHTTLVTGAARREDIPAEQGARSTAVYYNSIEVIASGGTIIDSYDKVHLVPFGEYLPFNDLLRKLGLRNFVDVPGGFEPGTVRRPLAIPGMPSAAPSICYEAIFPGEVLPTHGAGASPARFLLNVTDDGWFGLTSGPPQHLAQARLRTIEEGLPMIRGAATGISAFIDPYGRLLEKLPLGAEGILDGPLSNPIKPPLFARYRDRPFWFLWAILLLTCLVTRLRRR